MSSSTEDDRPVSAPPPTPSATNYPPSSVTATPNLLSNLLLRLPPTLSLPTRRPGATATLPLVSLSSETFPSSSILSAATQQGFLQLTHHSVSHELARSAESESFSLFPAKPVDSPRPWPVGYDHDDDREFQQELFCFDKASFTESTRSLSELTSELERVGMNVLEGVGFGAQRVLQPLMWVSVTGQRGQLDGSGRVYPYVVGLEYQIRLRKVLLFGDSGSVLVSPQVDSILVTFGDIAQVWSNGKIKKVRGRPVPVIPGEISDTNTTTCVSMTMLLTLPLESIVSPHLPQTLKSVQHEKDDESDDAATFNEVAMFDSFSFEDYAWRVYHDRLHLKDSLDRYRLI